MRLITDGRGTGTIITKHVGDAKVGLRFDRIELNEEDFQALRRLSGAQLQEWLDHWATGFIPRAKS